MNPSAEAHLGDGLWASVVIANYNRPALVQRLLGDLSVQTLDPRHFEVIVVDDGSEVDVRTALGSARPPFSLLVHRQANGGAAVARQRGAELARGKVVIFLDDDMRVGPEFVERHLELHDAPRTLVLGQLRPDADIRTMPLFERFFARQLDKKADALLEGREELRGSGVYTGNMSVDRQLFLEVGGFDPRFKALEDEELGLRLEKAGARLLFSGRAGSVHGSDKTSLEKWLQRAYNDGAYSVRVGRKHPEVPGASAFRHLAKISRISLPFLGVSLLAPGVAAPIARLAARVTLSVDKLGLEPLAIAGTTLVYGIQFYRGVRAESGSLGALHGEYQAFRRALGELGPDGGSAYDELVSAIREDHSVLVEYQGRYGKGEAEQAGEGVNASLPADAVKKIGLQIMVAYRLMRFFRARGIPLAAQFTSRLIRHLYGSDIHWDAEFAPGVMLVHGFGLAISHSARVARGCILFQGVTLGYGTDPRTGLVGAPALERNVHVGIGATLFGPITVGESSKIMAGCVLAESVPARSLVCAPKPEVVQRAARGPRAV